MANIQDIFEGIKLTENGDIAYDTTGDRYTDILFMGQYFQKHLNEVNRYGINKDDLLFAMMMRDPRFGFGYRDLGRKLMKDAQASPAQIVAAGRYDDLIYDFDGRSGKTDNASYIMTQVYAGNELAKKWMPRFGSKDKVIASKLAKTFGLSKQEYGHLVKANTTERYLTEKDTDKINFSQVPSLASIKYAHRFATGDDTKERYEAWKDAVKCGNAKVNVSVTNCYDIYKHRNDEGFDPDMFFDKLEKIKISCMPIVDSSGSMQNSVDAYGKAMAIGHYLAKCSTYCPNTIVSFSSQPRFLDLTKDNNLGVYHKQDTTQINGEYKKEIRRMHTGDCSNTNFAAVMDLMKQVNEFPDYIVVLSDMEFDYGSSQSTKEVEKIWRENGCNTKIIWWNFNDRNRTVPEKTKEGNIYMSGYSPMLLKYLEAGFDSQSFIQKLLSEYKTNLEKNV